MDTRTGATRQRPTSSSRYTRNGASNGDCQYKVRPPSLGAARSRGCARMFPLELKMAAMTQTRRRTRKSTKGFTKGLTERFHQRIHKSIHKGTHKRSHAMIQKRVHKGAHYSGTTRTTAGQPGQRRDNSETTAGQFQQQLPSPSPRSLITFFLF